MFGLTLDTWISLAVLLTAMSSMYWALQREAKADLAALGDRTDKQFAAHDEQFADLRQDIKSEISGLRLEVKSEISDLRLEIKSEISDLRDDVRRLDDRVYALASGLRPMLEKAGQEPA